jgi:hypothetical protein
MSMTRGLRHAFVLAMLIAGAPACGQEFHELDTDRDAFTPASRPVAAGRVVTEASYSFIDNRGTPATNSFPELLVRLGASEWFEWRFGANYEAGSGGSVVTAVETGEGVEGEELASESNVLYGFKALVTEQSGWVPRSSAIVEAFTPLSGDVWGTEPAITYVFGWQLACEWRFDAAIRYVLADSAQGLFNKWMPSAVLRMPVTERWEVHAEWFGTWSEGLEDEKVRPFVGPGTHFMIAPNLEIGCRMGWGLTQDAASYFVDSGLGWRF